MKHLPACLVAAAAIAFPPAGSATNPAGDQIHDGQTTVSFAGGPYFAPNQTARADERSPVCDDAGLLCDQFELTMNLSADLRERSSDKFPTVEVRVEWELDNADYDVYIYDGDGNLIEYGYTTTNPELLYVPLEDMPNGTYRIVMVPWQPAAQSFDGTVAVTGLDGSKSVFEILGGAPGLATLLVLAAAALARRRA